MFVTKKSLARRTFLQGMGAVVGLPLLDAMVPALTATAKTAANPRTRFGAIYVPHGVILEQWIPKTVGTGFDFLPVMKPLEPFKNQLAIVSNLTRGGGNNHAVACAAWLTAAIPKPTEAEDVYLGTSMDQVVAKAIGQDTPFPSLELATEDFTGFVGGCSTGYSCAYMNTISWTSPTTPQPMEINPRVVFERLFGRAGTAEQRQARRERDRSLLDSIAGDVQRLQGWLGARDKVRLGEYLDNVREIERRIQRMEAQQKSEVLSLDAPVGVPDDYAEHAGLLYDLAAVAFQADLTRVFSFMMARDLSTKTYPNVGVTSGHHDVSHHGGNPAQMANHAAINIFHLQLFAAFLEKLKSTPDGDGSVLDHSLMVYGSGMGNGNIHAPDQLPMAVVGGPVKRSHRHVQTAEQTSVGNLWLSVAQAYDLQIDRFGSSTGTVDLF
jgi:hypothetical protein